jgi:hypothetical protein
LKKTFRVDAECVKDPGSFTDIRSVFSVRKQLLPNGSYGSKAAGRVRDLFNRAAPSAGRRPATRGYSGRSKLREDIIGDNVFLTLVISD